MKEETTREVSTELYSMLGYDQQSKRVRMGMLAEKTHPYIRDKVTIIQILTDFSWGNWFSPRWWKCWWRRVSPNGKLPRWTFTTWTSLSWRSIVIAGAGEDLEGHTREYADQDDRQLESSLCQVLSPTPSSALWWSSPSLASFITLIMIVIRLKERDIKIAICTSDSREGTVEFLERMGLQSMVDIIVCGDDEVWMTLTIIINI